MITCECGRALSNDWVALADYCTSCGTSPVVEKVAPDPEHEKVHRESNDSGLAPISGDAHDTRHDGNLER